jgi:hypothetical protein
VKYTVTDNRCRDTANSFGEKVQQIPTRMGAIAADHNLGIEDVVLRETDELLEAGKEFTNRLMALRLAEIANTSPICEDLGSD